MLSPLSPSASDLSRALGLNASTAQMLPPPVEPAEPADERPALVRFDLRDTAIRYGLRCVARAIDTASTTGDWQTIAADFGSRRTVADAGNRYVLAAAEDAADEMALHRLDGAVERLAKSCGETVDEWIVRISGERAQKGGAL